MPLCDACHNGVNGINKNAGMELCSSCNVVANRIRNYPASIIHMYNIIHPDNQVHTGPARPVPMPIKDKPASPDYKRELKLLGNIIDCLGYAGLEISDELVDDIMGKLTVYSANMEVFEELEAFFHGVKVEFGLQNANMGGPELLEYLRKRLVEQASNKAAELVQEGVQIEIREPEEEDRPVINMEEKFGVVQLPDEVLTAVESLAGAIDVYKGRLFLRERGKHGRRSESFYDFVQVEWHLLELLHQVADEDRP